MSQAVKFDGTNRYFGPPPNDYQEIYGVHAFVNKQSVITKWEFTEAEIAEIIKTKCVFVSMMSAPIMFPHFVGTEEAVREINADAGVWKK